MSQDFRLLAYNTITNSSKNWIDNMCEVRHLFKFFDVFLPEGFSDPLNIVEMRSSLNILVENDLIKIPEELFNILMDTKFNAYTYFLD